VNAVPACLPARSTLSTLSGYEQLQWIATHSNHYTLPKTLRFFCLSVCLSVCPSLYLVFCKWK